MPTKEAVPERDCLPTFLLPTISLSLEYDPVLRKYFIGIVIILVTSEASAFRLPEHERITRRAVLEFNHCFDNALSRTTENTLVSANKSEDTDLINKWLWYSHFYHPEKPLEDMRRYDSSVRVNELEAEIKKLLWPLKQDNSELYTQMGYVVHHFQDMASPLHVVPVMHGLGDKFEAYVLTEEEFQNYMPENIDCTIYTTLNDVNLFTILKETAAKTLAKARDYLFAFKDGQLGKLRWKAFWKESEDNSFGQYGFLGNVFGVTKIKTSLHSYDIAESEYKDFTAGQLRLGINATERALYWLHREKKRFPPSQQQQ